MTCACPGCPREAVARWRPDGLSYCSMHWKRLSRHGVVGEAEPRPRHPVTYGPDYKCSCGCGRKVRANGLSNACYMRTWRQNQRSGVPEPEFIPTTDYARQMLEEVLRGRGRAA